MACLAAFSMPLAAVERHAVDDALAELDHYLEQKSDFIAARQNRIDSLCTLLNQGSGERADLLMAIASNYIGFNNDSAIVYLHAGATELPSPQNMPFRWELASVFPLNGFFDIALKTFEQIPSDSIPDRLLPEYYDAGRQMHSYMAAFFRSNDELAAYNDSCALDYQKRMLDILPHNSQAYRYNLAEYYFLTGHTTMAKVLLEEIIESEPAVSNLRARAAHHLSRLAQADGDVDDYMFYLALSATADVLSATREVVSLQELGTTVYAAGDIARAHKYLSSALESAVECGAPLRMIDTSRSLPIIERAHTANLKSQRKTIYLIISGMAILVAVLIVTMLVLRHEMHKMSRLHAALRAANTAKEVYISQFLQLCSIYMDKLNQFCKIATRKLAAGQADELYRMTRSGKFVEEQSREFYEVFDNAFLHIYPDFVARVNALLRADAKIELAPGEMLNTDLRILAFMRLGIEESARIAQVLNYSLNTIYSYRNRLKARAINRETFEADIMKITSEDSAD